MNILYLNNYMNDEVISMRNNEEIFSQAANNKIMGIYNSLMSNGIDVKIISTAIMDNRSFKYYKGFEFNGECKVHFAGIIDIPLINTLSSIFFTLNKIRQYVKKDRVHSIIFYNYKPEVAFAAYIAKKLYKIPIIIEYEDGYKAVNGLCSLKSKIFRLTERFVSKAVDGAILVTSKINVGDVPRAIIRGITNEKLLEKSLAQICSDKRKMRIAFTSGLDEERGIRVLIESLKYTKKDFGLIITGRGPLEQVARECLDERVKYLGFLPYEEVNNILLSSDILINAQLTNHSFGQLSFPSKVFEYISTGNLVISSDVSDILDFHRGLLYIYRNDDPKELARMIDKAIDDIEKKIFDKEAIFKLAKENLPKEVGKRVKSELLEKIMDPNAGKVDYSLGKS